MEKLKDYEVSYLVWQGLNFPPFATLAEALGKSTSTVKTLSKRYKWAEQKDRYLAENAKGTDLADITVNQKTVEQLIDEALTKVSTGQITVKSIKDIKLLEEIRQSRIEASQATSIDNLGALVTILAKTLIEEGMQSWEDIPDPDKEEDVNGEYDNIGNIEEETGDIEE